MKNYLFLNALLCMFILFCISSCNRKTVEINNVDQKKTVNSENKKMPTLEEQINNGNLKIDGKEFIPDFIDNVWSCNLPVNSTSAISEGFTIINTTEASSDVDDWTYAGRYGFTKEIEVSNNETTVLYWENETESKIWSFKSVNEEIKINGMNPIGKDIPTIVKVSSLPSAIEGNTVKYENKDFSIKLIFEKNICTKVEFENFI